MILRQNEDQIYKAVYDLYPDGYNAMTKYRDSFDFIIEFFDEGPLSPSPLRTNVDELVSSVDGSNTHILIATESGARGGGGEVFFDLVLYTSIAMGITIASGFFQKIGVDIWDKMSKFVVNIKNKKDETGAMYIKILDKKVELKFVFFKSMTDEQVGKGMKLIDKQRVKDLVNIKGEGGIDLIFDTENERWKIEKSY